MGGEVGRFLSWALPVGSSTDNGRAGKEKVGPEREATASGFETPLPPSPGGPPHLCLAGLQLHPNQNPAWQTLAVVAFE